MVSAVSSGAGGAGKRQKASPADCSGPGRRRSGRVAAYSTGVAYRGTMRPFRGSAPASELAVAARARCWLWPAKRVIVVLTGTRGDLEEFAVPASGWRPETMRRLAPQDVVGEGRDVGMRGCRAHPRCPAPVRHDAQRSGTERNRRGEDQRRVAMVWRRCSGRASPAQLQLHRAERAKPTEPRIAAARQKAEHPDPASARPG